MKPSSLFLRFVPLAMALIALIILSHSIKQSLAPLGSTDFHSYWYYGHFVRQGSDPYLAYFNQDKPHLPVKYLDGKVVIAGPIAKPHLAHTPANTAPIVLLLSVFSFFSWETAKIIWMIINLVLTFVIPWITIRLLPPIKPLTLFHSILIFFLFFVLQGTRIANWVGQTTLLVFVLMLGSLVLARKNWILAGFMLGLALAKYSLAISVFLFFLFKRDYRILAVSLITQIIGVLLISLLGKHTPILTIGHYLQMVAHHTSLPGIHLASLFAPRSKWAIIFIVLGSLVFFAFLWENRIYSRDNSFARTGKLSFADWHILSAMVLWSLLVAYHRAYDTLTLIIFIALIIYGLSRPVSWDISRHQSQILSVFLVFFIGIMSIPSSLMGLILSPETMIVWYQWVSYTMTIALITALITNLWVLKRMPSLLISEV